LAIAIGIALSKRVSAERPHVAGTLVFMGMCDASSAVPITDRFFLVANDEDNVLRAYDARTGGKPVWQSDVSGHLHLPIKNSRKKARGRSPETDIEAATRLGERAYWLTSHGRDRSGKLKPERFRFFATTVKADAASIETVGAPYELLLDDLLSSAKLEKFNLREAAERAPGDSSLNIEGMTERVEGGVWIGFRSPVPDGKALLVPLLNPEGMIHGARAELGEPALLQLNGLGIRGLSWWRGRYLVIAGPPGDGGASSLFFWDGKQAVRRADGVDLGDLNPEGFFTPEKVAEIFIFSDDGASLVDGTACKRLKDSDKKRFRGRWIKLGPTSAPN
jgi:hypothetical protein